MSVNPLEIAASVGLEVIGALQQRPDVLAYLKSTPSPDFVFVEDSVSVAMEGIPGDDAVEGAECGPITLMACGDVFTWLQAAHGIAPPAWYLRELEHQVFLQVRASS